jgi:hypothetical protein
VACGRTGLYVRQAQAQGQKQQADTPGSQAGGDRTAELFYHRPRQQTAAG